MSETHVTGSRYYGSAPARTVNAAADRYADLRGRFDDDLIDRHRGLLRHVVGPHIHLGVPPGRYAIRPAVPGARANLAFYEVRQLELGDDLRVLLRRGLGGAYMVVPRHQVEPGFRRIAEAGPALAAGRYRWLTPCHGCGARLTPAQRHRETCDRCNLRARARWARRLVEQAERAADLAGLRAAMYERLARQPGGVLRRELHAELRVGRPAGVVDRELAALVAEGLATVASEVRLDVRGRPCRQKVYRPVGAPPEVSPTRARGGLTVIAGGAP
jgi:hypothetical protein